MRAHIVENGVVVNTILVDSLNFLPGLIDAGQGGKIGDLWDGESFSTPDPTPVVPDSITPRQGELALIEFGIYDAVKAYFESLPGKEGAKARADFYRATEWRRDWALLNNAAKVVFGLTDEQIDTMFIYGAQQL